MKAIRSLFEQRIRGIRLVDAVGVGLALAMIFWVLLSKVREGDDIRRMNDLDAQIAEQQQAVDTLKIRVAGLERPARLEALATQYLNMKPVESSHEADLDSIGEISHATSQAVPVAAASSSSSSSPAADLITVAPQTTPQTTPQATPEIAR